MAIKLGKYDFEGPYQSTRQIFDKPGVFAVLATEPGAQAKFYLIDVGEAEKSRTIMESPDNLVKWTKAAHGLGKLAVAIHYSSDRTQAERAKIVEEVRKAFEGKR
ncbi:MAG: hypothetical protein WCJ46_07425 [bacterium]